MCVKKCTYTANLPQGKEGEKHFALFQATRQLSFS
jgi:hypothetical protein